MTNDKRRKYTREGEYKMLGQGEMLHRETWRGLSKKVRGLALGTPTGKALNQRTMPRL